MSMGYGLQIEQTQKLIMTPELRQAITILQLSSFDLSVYVNQQLQENPLLELQEGDIQESGQNVTDEPESRQNHNESGETRQLDWQEYLRENSNSVFLGNDRSFNHTTYAYEGFLSQSVTLTEHLMLQLRLTSLKKKECSIGEYLIGNIDGNGYLQSTVQEMARDLMEEEEEVQKVLFIIQTFDPVGVGARSLEECLLIQVEQKGFEDSLLRVVIQDYLVDLSKGKIAWIAQSIGVALKEIQRVADTIKTLDPKPGRKYGKSNDAGYIIPDVILQKVDNQYFVLINDSIVPRITVSTAYRAALTQDKDCDKDTRCFVESKLNAAAWLLRSIEQRRQTLYKVASCLVDLQKDFLEYGYKHLRPLNLKTVAERTGLHESTVSRATSNKYIQTPLGVLEMKSFFSSGLTKSSGESASSECVKRLIQEIVGSENLLHPYNDQKIADILKDKGIQISRRTVAKYRDRLGIAPVLQRKRY
ncbi:MAG: RNA polymerase factor sigma-54 [Peptococcaceae bacterium]|nr:RNA polymerase factor sigma-54 [Peptococcaceae bacterium]